MNKILQGIGIMFFLIMLSACGSSSKIIKPMDNSSFENVKYKVGEATTKVNDIPDHFLAAVKGHLKSELRKRNLLNENGENNTFIVEIDVKYYRMRSGFTRAFFGVLAGKDGIDSTITIIRNSDKSIVGESNVSTFNIMAIGNQDDIAHMHAKEIAKFIAGEKKEE